MKRPAAACSTAAPPATEPVKATWSTPSAPDHLGGRRLRHVHGLEEPVRQPGGLRCLFHPLGAERRLVRVLEDDRVAGHQRRHDSVDGGEVGIVPGRDHEHDAERLAADEAAEARLRLRLEIGERPRRGGDHVARPLLEAAHLARRVADRAAHLPGDLGRDLVPSCDERVDEGAHQRRALLDGAPAPSGLCPAGALERAGDLVGT